MLLCLPPCRSIKKVKVHTITRASLYKEQTLSVTESGVGNLNDYKVLEEVRGSLEDQTNRFKYICILITVNECQRKMTSKYESM